MSDIRLYDAMNGIADNARGGLVDKTQLSWLAENGPEMVIPLDGSSRAFELWEQASQFMNGSLLDRYDINAGGSSETTIEYNPVLQFYGEAPSKSDLDSALKTSQDEFEAMMEKYLKKQARLAF
jgi:SLT domain-containing protein